MIDRWLTFARAQVDSGDIDPAYPVLRWLIDHHCADDEEATAFVLLYVAYYNLTSALETWLDGWRIGDRLTGPQLRRPTGTERRAHRDVIKFARHIDSLNTNAARFGSLRSFLLPQHDHPSVRWLALQERLGTLYGNGRWAGYKTGEIADTVLGWRCPPPDAGHAHSSGPRHGLADLFPDTAPLTDNGPRTLAVLDAYTDELVRQSGLPVAQVETALCDWHSVLQRRYYVGHDIDQQLEQTGRADNERVREEIMRARAAVFDDRWRGEVCDWRGVRLHLRGLYVDRGIISWWEEHPV